MRCIGRYSIYACIEPQQAKYIFLLYYQTIKTKQNPKCNKQRQKKKTDRRTIAAVAAAAAAAAAK